LHSGDLDTGLKFELNNEIESLTKEISDLRKNILNQNANIIKELDMIETTRVPQMKKMILAYANCSFNSLKKNEDHIMEKMFLIMSEDIQKQIMAESAQQ
jgi:hypothetical protein